MVEVMVALAIFGICTTFILKNIETTTTFYADSQQKIYAAMISRDYMEVLIRKNPNVQEENEFTVVDRFSQQWIIDLEYDASSNGVLRKVTVRVAAANPRTTYAELIGYLPNAG